LKKAKVVEKRPAREFQFSSLLFYMEEKRPSFVESSDSDIGKLVSNVVSEITKSTKYVPGGIARVHFISQSRFGLITAEIKLSRAN